MDQTKQKVQIGGLAGWAIAAIQRGRRTLAARKNERSLEVVETLSLGGKRQVALVSCNGEHFLVGMGAESVTAIARVQDGARPQQPRVFAYDPARDEAPVFAAEPVRDSRRFHREEEDVWDNPRSFPLGRPRGLSQRSEAGR